MVAKKATLLLKKGGAVTRGQPVLPRPILWKNRKLGVSATSDMLNFFCLKDS